MWKDLGIFSEIVGLMTILPGLGWYWGESPGLLVGFAVAIYLVYCRARRT